MDWEAVAGARIWFCKGPEITWREGTLGHGISDTGGDAENTNTPIAGDQLQRSSW